MAGREPCCLVEPAGKDGAGRNSGCLAREHEEDRLSNFLGQMDIADEADARRIDEVHVPLHERSKSLLGLAGRVLPQELQVVHTGWPLLMNALSERKRDIRMLVVRIIRMRRRRREPWLLGPKVGR